MQRQTQLANDIWPLLLPRIRAMITAAASGSGGGSGAVNLAAHDLGGSLHKDTLRNDQAPQFLMLDGSRPLAGSLAVDAGVTIDGVDISAHAADINAHHAKLHGITDAANHSVTGSQYQIVGLTAVNTLGLLTPKSSPVANEIIKTDGSSAVTLVDLTVTSDLFMSGYLDFGTDVIYEDASYLQVTGSKAVRFGQNIGNANWTVYNAGGAQFGGNVDITGSGDLYVAGSLGGAGGVLKTSGNRVGIACVPDSQFALDVAGPARAQYFIGPHAIQLDNAVMICHYDGAAPYNTNYAGISLGHMGQVGTEGGGITYRPGKFGKAVQIAPATTNLITNPSFETGLTGWSTTAGTAVTQSSVKAYFGTYSALFSAAAGTTVFSRTISVTTGTTYTISAWVHLTSAAGSLVMDLNDKSYEFNVAVSTKNQWVRLVGTFTATATENAVLRFYSTDGAVGYIDGVQMEQKAYCTPYCDGSLGSGHTWSGTAHASTSSRTAAGLYYDVKVLDPAEGTVSMWVRIDGFYNNNRLLNGKFSDADFLIHTNSTGGGYFTYNSVVADLGPITAMTWVHVCVTWSRVAGKITTYQNGVQVAQVNISATASLDATQISVGSKWGDQQINGLIDDFAILSTAIDANRVRAIYESNAPVFAESSTVSWVATPSGLVWADERGLWMRDTSGNPVLGVYGGEAATYNWGGFDMSAGDLVLGRNAVGSSAIRWQKASGKFGFYGAGSGTPQVEIATDGSLTAGGGKVKLNAADGFSAFNAANAATIYINAEGIATGDGGARTAVASWTSGSRVKWYSVGELYAATPETYLDDSSVSRTLYPLVMRAIRQGNDAGLVEISAVNTSNVGAFVRVGEGFRLKDYYGTPYNTNRVVHASATDIILEATNLQLRSLTTSGAAVGSYSGKIRINIAGTNYYIPYYAS